MVEVVHGVVVNEVPEPAMMGGVCRIACAEGALCVASTGATLCGVGL